MTDTANRVLTLDEVTGSNEPYRTEAEALAAMKEDEHALD